jgi:hypothetical protein
VPDDAIVEDYAISAETHHAVRALIMEEDPQLGALLELMPPDMADARAVTMERLLEHVRDHFGSMTELVASLGIEAATIDALRGALVEPARA